MKKLHRYTDIDILKPIRDWFECLWHFWIRQRKLIVDFTGKTNILNGKQGYVREEYWTDEPSEDLHEKGYRQIVGLHDSLIWWKVPVYARFHGFRTIEITDPNFSKDTPMTLNDRMNSNLIQKFAKSLARATAIAGMDIQKLILMGAIGIAAVVGMKMFGVF